MTKPTVYIETSVLSYLTARPSRDVIIAGQQQITAEWWESSKEQYALFVSTVVVEEASSGNAEAAERRLESIVDIDVLEVTDQAIQLAVLLVQKRAIPTKAAQDALHIAVASVNQIQYLLTWNYKHIANATMRETINQVCREASYTAPIICTPAELGAKMWVDPIVEETRSIRDSISSRFDYDVWALGEYFKSKKGITAASALSKIRARKYAIKKETVRSTDRTAKLTATGVA